MEFYSLQTSQFMVGYMSMEKFELDISEDELSQIYIKAWVLMWCEKYHPEAFVEAEKFVKQHFNEQNRDHRG